MIKKYTQSNGRRPFGISGIVAGFDPHTGRPRLFQTDPAGTYLEWKVNKNIKVKNNKRQMQLVKIVHQF